MSQHNKLSLWQKLKRFLTASAPQAVVDDVKLSQHSLLLEAEISVDNDTDVDSETNDNNETNVNKDTATNTLQAGAYSAKANKKPSDNNVNDKNASSISSIGSAKTDIRDSNGIDSATGDKNNRENSKADTPNQTAELGRNTDIAIVDYLKQYFNDKQWHYIHYRPKTNDSQQSHHLSLRMRNKQLECGYLFRVQEKNNLLAVYGILPFLVPESHQNAAMLLITQINYDMLIGNLEMDVNDGEIRYKHAIDVEAVGINDHIIEHLLQSVIAMTTVAYEIFDDLINTQDPAEDMQTLLIELRQQADSRTFFLPTQFVQ
ncbi:YbjN domain-containing protein [Psychrobacter sp. FBL11]|uniref:YbjN domain-containing protein n=1 Tax=Psychrobacter saeujeotis TaxID=3143436 RepID=A0ABU9X3X4_9GAMM|nr:YbjN domain-containing protein [uncultured Psychrobacter sp.]